LDTPETPEGGIGPVVVLVEDNLDDFILFKRALNKSGLDATLRWARSGAEALSVLSVLVAAPAKVCVVLDLKLPDVTGFELLRAMKSYREGADIYGVVLTDDRQPGLEERARDFGADGFFLKPCGAEDLVAVLQQISSLIGAPGVGDQSG
jgi:two-component system response regulator